MPRFLFYDDKIMNILVKKERPSGGAAVQSYGWIRGLLAAGEEIHVLTHAPEREDIKEECQDIRVVPLYNMQKGIRCVRWLYYRMPYLYKAIRRNKPDYFYESVPCWKSFVFGIICWSLGIKYILRISNDCLVDDRVSKSRSRLQLFFQRLGMKLSYCILCQNNYQFNIISRTFPGKRIFKISNPVYLHPPSVCAPLFPRNYIAWLGIFQYQKNLPLLYEIASLLSHEHFAVAGKEHPDCDDETSYFIRKLRELPNVHFLGFLNREEVLPFLAKAKFLLNTSHYEGFSNTFLEAMSVATPIITSQNVNPDNIISDNKLGLIFRDAEDLRQQISNIDPESYRYMSASAAEYVREHDYRVLSKRLLGMLSCN